jgi:hypothetical protein
VPLTFRFASYLLVSFGGLVFFRSWSSSGLGLLPHPLQAGASLMVSDEADSLRAPPHVPSTSATLTSISISISTPASLEGRGQLWRDPLLTKSSHHPSVQGSRVWPLLQYPVPIALQSSHRLQTIELCRPDIYTTSLYGWLCGDLDNTRYESAHDIVSVPGRQFDASDATARSWQRLC